MNVIIYVSCILPVVPYISVPFFPLRGNMVGYGCNYICKFYASCCTIYLCTIFSFCTIYLYTFFSFKRKNGGYIYTYFKLSPKMSSVFISISRRSTDPQKVVVNSNEVNYPKIPNKWDNWKFPKISLPTIYKKGSFKFFFDYTIKTIEHIISLEQDDQVIRLLDSKSKQKHKKYYNFIHLGMIQITAKPLVRIGLNTLIIICLRYNRHLDYRDSIIEVVLAGLNSGPIYL